MQWVKGSSAHGTVEGGMMECVFALVRVVDMSSTVNITEVCLQETGGLGVDCIIDNGGKHPLRI